MSGTDTKLDPAAEVAAEAEPKLAKQETELVTHPVQAESTHDDNKDDEKAVTTQGEDKSDKKTEDDSGKHTGVTGALSDIAATTKDSVFSMFGGGSKGKKKEEAADEPEEESGSSKKKNKAEDDEEV